MLVDWVAESAWNGWPNGVEYTIKQHLPGILAAYKWNLNNATAECINSQVQAAIVRARGFQNPRSLMNMIYLTTGKLSNLPAPPFVQALAGAR
jgi:hypothetical protein